MRACGEASILFTTNEASSHHLSKTKVSYVLHPRGESVLYLCFTGLRDQDTTYEYVRREHDEKGYAIYNMVSRYGL